MRVRPPAERTDVDFCRPHPARVNGYLLGGKDNYVADRDLAGVVTKVPKARVESLLRVLGDHRRRHEVRPAGACTRKIPPCPTAFPGLLDGLAPSCACLVVTPALAYQGLRPVAAKRQQRLVDLGARLLLVRGGHRKPLVWRRRRPLSPRRRCDIEGGYRKCNSLIHPSSQKEARARVIRHGYTPSRDMPFRLPFCPNPC
ncbi:SAM-dependent methyltransferase [Streptomyces phytophilus]|uniref:SAM-dependent methyltransferase n=1 Tax=Streptomyces phytophilus TaxID=722715 RepID=UPI00215DB68E|nr:SAM-dependent methyltransferase [Streptomyces phytophilus]